MGNCERCAGVLLVLAFVACEGRDPIAPEPSESTSKQAFGRVIERTRTADTDKAQLRAFNVSVPLTGAPNDVVDLIRGPFVITGYTGNPNFAFINFDGVCPPIEEWAAEPFFERNVYVNDHSAGSLLVPAGAALCAPRPSNSMSYSYNVSGYIPYE